jgi:hypothetical protein
LGGGAAAPRPAAPAAADNQLCEQRLRDESLKNRFGILPMMSVIDR